MCCCCECHVTITVTCWATGWRSVYDRRYGERDGNRLAEWNRQIPRQDTLTPKHKLCDLHFEDRFITKSEDFTIKGQRVSFPRTVWRLTDDVVPTVFPNLPQYLSRLNPKSSNFVHNSSNRMTYPPQKGHAYGHMTVSKFWVCREAACRTCLSETAELLVSKDERLERAVLCKPREVCEAAGASRAVASALSGSSAWSLLCLDATADSWCDGGGASKCAAGVSNNHDATLDRSNCSPETWHRLPSMDIESRSGSACCGPALATTGQSLLRMHYDARWCPYGWSTAWSGMVSTDSDWPCTWAAAMAASTHMHQLTEPHQPQATEAWHHQPLTGVDRQQQ